MMKLFVFAAFCLALSVGSSWAKYAPNWESLDARPLPAWYDQAKVGIFMHWGVFSVPSFRSEWFWEYWKGNKEADVVNFMKNNYKPSFTYADFAPEFKAEFFNPDEWAELFKASGAKYVVLTSKHHEGYTNWPSKYAFNWNAKAVGPNRDLVGDLAAAVRNKTDIKFGLYHSLYEWFNPEYLADKANHFKTQTFVKSKTMPELYEIINNYKPELIWSDGDWEAPYTYWDSTNFLAWLYNSSPVKDTIVVNDRWGAGMTCHHGGYYTCQDRYNPRKLQNHKWENAMTLDKVSWGYRRNAKLSDYLTSDELITTLAETVSCGGNLLVNIGPTKEGTIVPVFEERLRDLGKWLSINGEAVYNSKPWKAQNDTVTPNVWYTSVGTSVYAMVLDWPAGYKLTLGSAAPSSTTQVTLLGYTGKPLSYKANPKGGMDVMFPVIAPDTLKWAWVLKMTNLK